MKEKERMSNKNNMTLTLEKMTILEVSENQMSRNELSKKRSLQEKGITLIALVVTIIILLILAGVTLNMALSDGGLFKKTQQVAQKSTEAMMKEEVALLFTEWEADYYETGVEVSGRSGDTMSGAFVEYDGETIIYEKDGRTYEMPMSANGETGEIKEVEPDKNSQSYKARHPEDHIPAEFHHTIGTVSTGYVIEDSDGNEFVWIPVDGNRIKYEKKLGKNNWSLKENDGKESLSDLSEGIKGDLLGTFEGEGELAQQLSSNEIKSKSNEKAIIENAGGFWVGRYEAGVDTSVGREKNVIGNDIEATLDGSDYDNYWEDNKNNIVVKSGMEPVRMMTQKEALKVANSWRISNRNQETKVEFQSGLITGTEWDVICEFIGWNICNSSNQSWGNCWDVLGERTYNGLHSSIPGSNWMKDELGVQKPCRVGTPGSSNAKKSGYWIFPTGRFVNSEGLSTEKKHLFDILGNVSEFTTEICKNCNNMVVRGASASDIPEMESASFREGNINVEQCSACIGFRIVMYVKRVES